MVTPQQSEKSSFKSDRHDGGFSSEHRSGKDSMMSGSGEAAMRSGASEVRQGARDAAEGGKEIYEGIKDMASEGYDAACKATCDATDSLRATIARNPGASVAIAAGIGVVLGSLLLTRLRS